MGKTNENNYWGMAQVMVEVKNGSSADTSQTPMTSSLANESLRLLMQASLLQGEPAKRAWQSWQSFCDVDSVQSESYQMLPSLYLNLTRLGINYGEMSKLRGIYKHTWVTNQVAMRSLLEVLQLLLAESSSILLQRSLALIFLQYCDRGVFQIGEIELLIRIEEVGVVDTLLQIGGWQLRNPLPPKRLLPLFHGTSYTHPEWGELFVRWRPFTINCSPKMERQLWKRARKHTFNGMIAKIPDLHDLLLLTCLQGHDTPSYDISRALAEAMTLIHAAGSSIDWETINNRAKRLGMQDQLATILNQLHQEFNIELPTHLSDQIAQLIPNSKDHIRPGIVQPRRLHQPGSIRESLARMWDSYRIVCSFNKQKSSFVEFVPFFLSYYQFSWKLRWGWLVPLEAVTKVFRRLEHIIVPRSRTKKTRKKS